MKKPFPQLIFVLFASQLSFMFISCGTNNTARKDNSIDTSSDTSNTRPKTGEIEFNEISHEKKP
jgi:hypothetical protein